MFGHHQRRAIKARRMTREQWRELCSQLRRESRNEYTKQQRRAADLARELCAQTGVLLGKFGRFRAVSFDQMPGYAQFTTDAGRTVTRAHQVAWFIPHFNQSASPVGAR